MSVSTRSPALAAATIRRTPAPPAGRDDVPASGTRDFEFDDRDFRRVADLIRQRAGIALADGKREMGRIVIEFFDNEDLTRLLETLNLGDLA